MLFAGQLGHKQHLILFSHALVGACMEPSVDLGTPLSISGAFQLPRCWLFGPLTAFGPESYLTS